MTRSRQLIKRAGYTVATVPSDEVRYLLRTANADGYIFEMLRTIWDNRPDLWAAVEQVGREESTEASYDQDDQYCETCNRDCAC